MMKLFFHFFLLFHVVIVAQTKTEIISYDVKLRLPENDYRVSGDLALTFKLIADQGSNYLFKTPAGWEIQSINDKENNSFDYEIISAETSSVKEFEIEIPSSFKEDDTLQLVIGFSATIDTLSSNNIFLNKEEFILSHTSTNSWLPHFGSETAQQFSLELTTTSSWKIFADAKFDTFSSQQEKIWKRSSSQPTTLASAFTFYGIHHGSLHSVISSDSLTTVSFYSNPARFNQQYAALLTRQIRDALHYLSMLTNRNIQTLQPSTFTIACIGTRNIEQPVVEQEELLILPNSPAYIVFDSSLLVHSIHNRWLKQIALRFVPKVNDSLELFRDGFAAYLTMRFLSETNPSIEKNERRISLFHALHFFPTNDVPHVRMHRNKYFFLMLEYLLGRETFDSLLRTVMERYATTPISVSQFQLLCEEEYGSSLGWFFDQWLNRASAPEYVMEWRHEKTPRGMFVTKIVIEQRSDNFSMPVTLVFTVGKRIQTKRVFVERTKQEFTFTFPTLPEKIELDPQLHILRWLLDIRIPAHARTALLYFSAQRDVINAEREALYTLQLDPNNSTGSSTLAYFVLGNITAARKDYEKAKEYFFQSMASASKPETEQYKIFSLIRFGNIVEIEGKRDEAMLQYQRAINEGRKNPVIYEHAILEAEKYLLERVTQESDIWFQTF